MISIVIPTIDGREDHFERCLEAYRLRTVLQFEILIEFDHPTVGLAWQAGAEKATGDYIHLTCDDLEPLDGWDEAAVACCDAGNIPAPKVTDAATGALQSRPAWGAEIAEGADTGISIIPFFSRAQWDVIKPLFTAHYYTDDFISFRARRNGWPSIMCNRYAFKHHWAQHGRGAGMTENQRMVHDQVLYVEAVNRVLRGEWTEPWPPPS